MEVFEPTPSPRRVARIVAGPKATLDPREQERQRLLQRVVAAEGRPAITRAIDDLVAGGFELPRTQSIWLQMLEHRDEARVESAILALSRILGEEPIERRAVLESRLRRIEEFADERGTRDAAAELLRRVLTTAGL